jgi:uncharacterized membrane protein YozB (DUF420 family)
MPPRRRSPWNIVLLAAGFVFVGLIWFFLCKYIIYLFQDPHTPFKDVASGHDTQMIFIVIPLFLPAVAWGLLCANALPWLIPPARRALEKEGKETDRSFKKTSTPLLIAAIILTLICVPVAVFSASRITVRPGPEEPRHDTRSRQKVVEQGGTPWAEPTTEPSVEPSTE